ncbi:retrotransposon hot spot (RHS) protein, putative, partial [Trypanosoma cruzi]
MPGNQASAVPQGDRRRRARPEFEDVTDQPAATHIRVEEARRPQWTMYSYIKDILLERNTNRTDMRLNEFIRSYLGEEWVVERNGNVVMEIFVLRPTMFIQNQQLLELIFNLTAYQELNERKILWEAVDKLHYEGVVSLRLWRKYGGKNTVTPVARRKLNAAISHVMREERREVEERREARERARHEAKERREARERARLQQKLELTVTTTIKDVLFRGRVRVMDMQLNDFLVMELDGMGFSPANRNVLLRDFFIYPTRYISVTFSLPKML